MFRALALRVVGQGCEVPFLFGGSRCREILVYSHASFAHIITPLAGLLVVASTFGIFGSFTEPTYLCPRALESLSTETRAWSRICSGCSRAGNMMIEDSSELLDELIVYFSVRATHNTGLCGPFVHVICDGRGFCLSRDSLQFGDVISL